MFKPLDNQNLSMYFTDKLESNLTCIRNKCRRPRLKIGIFKVNNSTIAVVYYSDKASYSTVRIIEGWLGEILIPPTENVHSYLLNKLNTKFDVFPLIRKTKREEWACKALYNGDVLILIDGVQYAYVAPRTLGRSIFGIPGSLEHIFPFVFRTIGYFALFVSMFLSSLYIAADSSPVNLLPEELSFSLNSIRGTVIFSAFIEVLILECLVEIIREALWITPPRTGLAIFIVSVVAIGRLLTEWSIFNPVLIAIVYVSFVFSLYIPDYLTIHSLRILKFLMVIATGFLGIFGFALILTLVTINIIILTRSGIPYSPFGWYELIHAFLGEAKARLLKSI